MSTAPHDVPEMPDLSVCDAEPIHIPGAIEPNGALLVIQEPDLTIVQSSTNARALLGAEAEELLGTRVADLLHEGSFEALRMRIASDDLASRRRYLGGVRLRTAAATLDASVHRHDGALIVELEPSAADHEGPELHSSLVDATTALDGPVCLKELCQRVAAHVRHLTGFDRVMVYQFLEDDTGCVIAEACREDMTPYLGLRYPASDIPAQARRLYRLNTIRLKADVAARTAPLVPPVNPLIGRPLDMTHCVLRAMSPVHVEYLRNMGVTASMSVSIVKDDRLWGLIACHHTTAKAVPHPLRISCEVLARVFSAHIAAAEQHDRQKSAARTAAFRERILERLRTQPEVLRTLIQEGDRLASIIDAHGAAACIGGDVALVGVTPAREDVERLLQWLDTHQRQHLFSADKLTEHYPPAEVFAGVAAALLSARIALGSRDFILWFRRPTLQVIEWGGNPAKPVQETEAGKRISPRLSFERWKETVGDRSEPWLEHQREFALALRQTSAEVLLARRNDEIMHLNEELERSNIELDAFAYAASHDLQEPIRTVRAYAQLVGRRAGTKLDDATRELVSVIENTAARMASLVSALLTFAQVGGAAVRQRKPVSLDDVVRAATLNLVESIRDSGAVITNDPLPTVMADADHMTQLVQNLVGNSIKYRKPDEPPRIHVCAQWQDPFWRISIQDNGQGFKPEETETIFTAFKRLHGRDIPGSGIGLALCRRIVEHHGGRIWAESKGKGQGSTFRFTLPQS